MDEYSGKKGIEGMMVPRKGMALVFSDTANSKDQNGQICSRLGCSSEANHPKVSQAGSSEKGKSWMPSMQSSSSGKEVIGSSSRTTTINAGKPQTKPWNTLTYQFETDSSETSSMQDEPEISELTVPPKNFPRGLQAEEDSTKSGNVIQMEVGRSSIVSNERSKRDFHQRPGLHQQDIESTGTATQGVSSRYLLRNLRCNSISGVIPDAGSSSDSTLNRRKSVLKKQNSEGESSSTVRGKKVTESSLEGSNSGFRNSISISDARGLRNIPSHRDSSRASVRTQRSVGGHARERFSSQVIRNHGSIIAPPVMVPLLPHSTVHNDPGIPFHISGDALPVSPPEYYGIPNSSINQDSFRRYNMDCIAEVLLALERIEQDEELTHEQLVLLENNFSLDGLNLYDHHRDMRLDVDNMSYEELLALEERIGSVSTALTEEALSACLKRSIYLFAPSDDAADYFNEDNDDIRCCICQEDYIVGDEVGTLQCNHKFHVVCIEEWLRVKNLCPICKETAATV